ncbi:MAG: EAL domain-containing protein [Rhizobiaceae bacterium]|nr:EAL domain-containing protein [Rhizobiaceae bacterium]
MNTKKNKIGDKPRISNFLIDLPAIMNAAPIATAICDGDFVIVYANRAFSKTLGIASSGIVGSHINNNLILSVDTKEDDTLSLEPGTFTRSLLRGNGTNFWGMISVSKRLEITKKPRYVVQVINVDNEKQDEEKLTYRESIWRNAVDGTQHGVWDHYVPTDERFYSDEWKRIRGIPTDEKISDTPEDWEKRLHPDDLDSARKHVAKHKSGGEEIISFEYRERHRDGNWIWILSRSRVVEWFEDGRPKRLTGSDVDITKIRKADTEKTEKASREYQRHLEELERAQKKTEAAHETADAISRQDPLTELANRRVFSDELERLTETKGQTEDCFAVLLIDLDRFKPINDIYGHQAGDQTICEVANRLEKLLGETSTVARLGGDEFGIIVKNDDSEQELLLKVEKVAEEVVDAIRQPIKGDGFEAEIGASIGISLYPQHGNSSQSLFRAADVAMYHVKKNGRGSWIVYDEEMGKKLKTRALLEEQTRRAVRNEEIQPWFQPVVDLKTGKISGFEILARWEHFELGSVAPDTFLPVIEQFGLMKDFTASMLRRACLARRDWPQDITLALNVSAGEICDPAMPVRLMNILSECEFLPTRLEIEVTESALLQDLDTAKQVISSLRESGIRVLLDDFGTGYAGLNYLREFSLDCLKIDRSFINSMTNNSVSKRIVRSILSLARELDLDTVAEGIEDGETHELVKLIGGSYGQGYFYGKAVPANEARALLDAANPERLRTG